ncbi:MAG TPA: hypothetical protein PKK61_04540 [Defluviitaleaceae bacterium]|jgi:hypothetical protein|nr:hypothetical protein [Candidatus Epulonipiscium sp.]HOA80316.1 hypothetical protein [Defluviitaleaceae bacterium]
MDYHSLMNLNGYIEFCGLTEPETNCLRLYFARCKTEETAEDLIIGDTVIKNTYSIIIDKDLPILQLDFESYIAYSVTNESFTSWDEYEQFEGKAFMIYTKSRYLDFIKEHTLADQICGDVYPPFRHYGIVCLNHIIDIVSIDTPKVTEIYKEL